MNDLSTIRLKPDVLYQTTGTKYRIRNSYRMFYSKSAKKTWSLKVLVDLLNEKKGNLMRCH